MMKLEHSAGVVPETVDEGPAAPMEWPLKSATVTRKNITATQKTYLTKVFQEGEHTRQKANPAENAMQRAMHSDGSSNCKEQDFFLA